jgi:uncharacterized membrane protein (UPF0127 family)
MRLILLISLTCIPFIAAGCSTRSDSATSTASLPTVQMKLGRKTLTLEVANTQPSREKGLMRRDSMPSDRGMIFVFPNEEPRLGFYMKNTRIPLDIIFVSAAGNVVSIKQMKPYDLTTTYADAPAKWAIELNQGAAAEAGVKVGDKLDIPPAAQTADP